MAATKAELFERIRGDSWREGLSVRAPARRYGVHRRLVREALRHAEPGRVSVFPHEICKAPRSRAERACPGLICFNEAGRGDHFAAGPEPALFATGVRAAFRSLR